MIKNIRHTGIVVNKLKKAIAFYEGLGFSILRQEIERGPHIESVVGLENAIVETVKLKSPCGGLLELLKYHSHPLDKKPGNQQSNQPGCSHIAITVNNIDTCMKYIREQGGSIHHDPSTSPAGNVKVAYCHDPEGVLMEIVEEI
tara:strand:- start:170 stop:601 length:432 start_codon:yes stop_codon:yes gene_type:complete